jgi:hypothetical protein
MKTSSILENVDLLILDRPADIVQHNDERLMIESEIYLMIS